jgi:peptide/nickel transport system substrate-binding protein
MSDRYFGSWQRRVAFAGAVTVVAAAAFAAAVATHTSKAAGVSAGVDNNTLVYAITDTPPDIDPNSSAEFVESELFTNTLSRLFDYKTVKRSDGTYVMQSAGYQPVVGSLVKSWTVSADKKTITVNLRTGVKNYLGDTFDAKDVVYTFDRLLALKGTGTFYESSIGITKTSNIKVVNPHKIVFKLDFPAELFFKMMSIPHMGIVDSVVYKQHATKSDPWSSQWAHTNSVGWGPYEMTQNQQGVQIVLKADPNFWGHKPAVQNIIEKAVPNSSNRLALLKGGAVDIAAYLQPRERISLKNDPNVKIAGFTPAQSHAILYMTNTAKPFDNKLVRQAVCYALPVDNIVKTVGLGTARAQQSPLPANYEFYAPQLDPYTYNVDKAKALLKQAGYPNGFSTSIGFSNDDPTVEQQAVMVQNALAAVGIKATLNKQPLATYSQNWLGAKYQMGMMFEGAFIPDFAYALHLWYYGPKKQNFLDFTDYYNKNVDKWLDQANHTFDQATRKQLALATQKQILQDAPICYLAELGQFFPTRTNIGGVNYFTYSALHFDLLTKS